MKLTPEEMIRWQHANEKARELADRANDPTFNPELKRQQMDETTKQTK